MITMTGLVDHNLVKEISQARLKNAAQEGQARRLSAHQPGFASRVRHGIGQALVAAGQKLKAQGQPAIVPQA